MSTTTSTWTVTGMTCGHCVDAVTTELKTLDGVQDVQVALDAEAGSTVTVTSTRPLEPREVGEAVDEAGYDLVEP